MKYLITGGCGFLGSNIASRLISEGKDVIIFDSLYRLGSTENLEWLHKQGEFNFIQGDIRNCNDIESLIMNNKPDFIYHLAGQVAMTTSIENPRLDFEVNTIGSFNLLEAIRKYTPDSGVVYSSTNKVYGDLEQFTYHESDTRYICEEYPIGFDEKINLDFHSPYGVSKGSADQYFLDYARIYDLNTAVFRHSSMFGGRQYATYDQGWVGWFIQKAIEIKNNKNKVPFTISGKGKQVRDVLHANDMVDLYVKIVDMINKIKGEAFNIGGGINNSFSLIELFNYLEDELNITMKYKQLPPRESDQKVFVADLSKVKALIGWQPGVNKEDGIKKMIDWVDKIEQ